MERRVGEEGGGEEGWRGERWRGGLELMVKGKAMKAGEKEVGGA